MDFWPRSSSQGVHWVYPVSLCIMWGQSPRCLGLMSALQVKGCPRRRGWKSGIWIHILRSTLPCEHPEECPWTPPDPVQNPSPAPSWQVTLDFLISKAGRGHLLHTEAVRTMVKTSVSHHLLLPSSQLRL